MAGAKRPAEDDPPGLRLEKISRIDTTVSSPAESEVAYRRRCGKLAACEPCRKRQHGCDHATPVCGRCARIKKPGKCVYLIAPLTKPQTPTTILPESIGSDQDDELGGLPQSAAQSEVNDENVSSSDSVSTTGVALSRRPKVYICQFAGCGKAFDRPVRLQAHQNTHTGEKPYACTEEGCDKKFYKPDHLKSHVQNIHAPCEHFCIFVVSTDENGGEIKCNKSFTTKTRLQRHVAIHQTKEETKCEHCGRQFRKLDTLQRHVQNEHSEERKEAFRCTFVVTTNSVTELLSDELGELDEGEECGRTFKTNGHLQQHQQKQHGTKKYTCSLCHAEPTQTDADIDQGVTPAFQEIEPEFSQQTSFNSYGELQAHVREAHPPTCSTCGTVCASNSALKAHIDIHHGTITDRKIHPCTWPDCNRSFTKKGNLSVHIQSTHVKTKKYICGEFNLSKTTKVAGWKGQGCGAALGTKASLETHVKTQHMGMVLSMRPSRLRKKVKFEDDDDIQDLMPFLDLNPLTPTESSSSAATPLNNQTLGLLTGIGYADSRPFACLSIEACPYRFTQHFHLAQHMDTVHRWSVDEINKALANDSSGIPTHNKECSLSDGNDFFMADDVQKYDGGFESGALSQGFDARKDLYNYAEPLIGLDDMFGDDATMLDPALMES